MAFTNQDGIEIFQENIRLKEDVNEHKLKCDRLESHPLIRMNQFRLEEGGPPKENTDNMKSYDTNRYQKQINEEGKSQNIRQRLKRFLRHRPHYEVGRAVMERSPLNVRQLEQFVLQEGGRSKLCSLFILVVLVIFVCLGYTFYQSKLYLNNSNRNAAELLKAAGIGEQTQLNIGMRQDYLLQECQGTQLKHSFPDLDYSLLGYNILQGFPLAVGHDPGFTLPIFVADYSDGGMTADCRYSVPKGLLVIPDVSCVTSFDSSTVQSQYQLSKSLSVSASASGEGWGVSFSASAGYKKSSSEISTGEYVYILSTARCNYYFSKLMKEYLPKFHSNFLAWVYILNNTNSSETYFDFFNTYGTHFPNYVTYGARFTYEHRMDSSKYETEKKAV